MKIAVSAETTLDMPKEMLEQYDVHVIPFGIVLGDEEFFDGKYTTEEIFEKVNQLGSLPKTNAINAYTYGEYFKELLKDYDGVIHVCLSGGITSSTENAKAAAKELKNVYVVDSQSLSTGIALLVLYARELAEQGLEPKEIYEKVQARVEKLQVSFVIERLDYLYKSGRCNSLQLLGANLLKLRPRIVLKEGKMLSDKKYRGRMEQVVSKYCIDTINEFNTPDLSKVFITYTTATPEMVAAASDALAKAGFQTVYETHAGGTIGCHCGEHTLGILYFNDGDKAVTIE